MKKGEDFIGIAITYFCHDGAGNYLMHKRGENCRDEHGVWDVGGGALEFGDKVEDTLRKEIKEEYCTEVLDYEFLGYLDVHRVFDNKNTHWIALEFKVKVDRDKVKNGEPHKFDEVSWFKIDNLPSPLHSQIPRSLEIYRGKL